MLTFFGSDLPLLQDEIEDDVMYEYEGLIIRKVWHDLFVYPNATEWPYALLLCELVFRLPF